MIYPTISFGQSVVCNSNGCVPSGVQASVQEKANYSAIDLGFNSLDLSVLTGSGQSIKPLRMSLSNGEFPGKNLDIDLSADLSGKDAGNIMVFADNIDTLNIKLNGYNGLSGLDASQICANRILSNQYGNDVRLRFLQRRSSPNSGLTNDRCAQVDTDDIQSNKFSCNDPNYSSLDINDPKINITRIRKISRCQSIVPQNVCLQKKYTVSCQFKLGVRFTDRDSFTQSQTNAFRGWNDAYSFVTGTNQYGYPNEQCQEKEFCAGFPACFFYGNFFRRNGTDIPTEFSKVYQLSEEQRAYYLNKAIGGSICKALIDEDDDYRFNNPSTNFQYYVDYQGKKNYDGGRGCHMDPFPDTRRTVNASNPDLRWESTTSNESFQETSPGRDSSLQRLEGGTPFTPSPNGNNALRQTNIAGWQLELMPAFFPTCNPYFTYITTETSNIIKSLFDPNLFNNNSAYCINPNDTNNCSINPPFCDNPESTINCRKVSVCEQINKKHCLDPNNSTNCSINPPFCDNPNDTNNCSSSPIAKSCDPLDPLNSFCDKDPNNLGQYQFIGVEPDPFKNTESLDCKVSGCPVTYKTVEQSSSFDTLVPTNGENGTLSGQGLFFVYDIRSINQESKIGQAGNGGKSDLVSPAQNRYCAIKRDFNTDPNTKYENDPEVIFKKIIWKSFDIAPGGSPGQFPPFVDKKIELYKKLDPGIRYLLKKELL